jgi:protein-S-isoprenylcysteine O-methyltransferase Ste14
LHARCARHANPYNYGLAVPFGGAQDRTQDHGTPLLHVDAIASGVRRDGGAYIPKRETIVTSEAASNPAPDTEHPAVRAAMSITVLTMIEACILFWSAGQWNWPRGWLLVGLNLLAMPVEIWVLSRMNPVLLRERFREHKGTQSFDKGVLLFLLPMTLVIFCVAGLDARFRWSDLGTKVILPGLALYLAGSVLILWVKVVNPYLESTVRIQQDRNHVVISSGPYRFVRHPMYVGAILKYASYPLILGHAWGYVPVVLLTLLYMLRTRMEDRTLREQLPGYAEYSQRTSYRLFPGLW